MLMRTDRTYSYPFAIVPACKPFRSGKKDEKGLDNDRERWVGMDARKGEIT